MNAPKADETPVQDLKSQDLSPLVLDTRQLFAGRNEIRLRHQGVEYRLRITKLGKLILTK